MPPSDTPKPSFTRNDALTRLASVFGGFDVKVEEHYVLLSSKDFSQLRHLYKVLTDKDTIQKTDELLGFRGEENGYIDGMHGKIKTRDGKPSLTIDARHGGFVGIKIKPDQERLTEPVAETDLLTHLQELVELAEEHKGTILERLEAMEKPQPNRTEEFWQTFLGSDDDSPEKER